MATERSKFWKTPWLALVFGGLHALLGGAAVVIQLLGVWDDMNPTMLVWLAFRYADYPLWMLVDALASSNASPTAVIIFVAILGTVAWACIGLVFQFVFAR
jgi:hypothetical protein